MTGPTEWFPTEDTPTEQLPVMDGATVAARTRSGFWRELSGSLAVGLCALAVVVLGIQVLASARGMPGPGMFAVVGHGVAAVVAVLLQRLADRRRGMGAAVPVVLVAGTTAATVWFLWWS